MSVHEILSSLANEPKTNSKLQILKDSIDNQELSKVFERALNPTVNYYIKAIPIYTQISEELSLSKAIDKLDKLSSRIYTGGEGIQHLKNILMRVSSEDASIIERIIKRDLRCGVNTATVNKIWKDLIPEFPYMRCSSLSSSKVKTWDWSKGVVSQLKADGRYNNGNKIKSGEIELLSRSGIALPNEKFAGVVEVLNEYFDDDTQTHGEFLVMRDGKILDREISNGIMNSVAKGGDFGPGEEAVYLVWDQIPLSESKPSNKYHVKYIDRLANLRRQCEQLPEDHKYVQIIETRIVYSVDEAIDHFEEMLRLGLEGTVLKQPDAIWEDTTSKFQVKLKLEVDDVDLEVVSFNPGNGKNKDLFGSILCRSGDGLLEVNFSGFKDAVRKELSNTREQLIGTILTGKANSIMKPKKEGDSYSLFLPRFKELRNDKSKGDTLPEIQAKFESAIDNIRKYLQ
jgi:DNA ligase-1